MNITTPSGAEVTINVAPWKNVMALKNAIQREISDAGVSLDPTDLVSTKDIDMGKLASLVMRVDSAPAVYSAIFACLVRCTYNGEKITEETFENERAREDYYEIVLACIKANLSPFFKALASGLRAFLRGQGTGNPA